MIKILLIEDDNDYANYFTAYMKNKAIAVTHIDNLNIEQIEQELSNNPDLVILDFFFGNEKSVNVFSYLNKKAIPIIYLTSNDDEITELSLLKQGAVDYIDKLKSLAVIEQKINKLVKNQQLEHVFYSNHLNIETKILNYKCQLTNNEYRIMDILIKNLDNFVSTESIMIELWNDNIFIEKNTLVVAIKRLREKIRKYNFNFVINSQKGKGYALNELN